MRPTTTLVVITATITGANFFTEPYLLTGRGGPNGASVSPVLLMYTEGIEQGHAGYAAAIGVLLAIGVIAVSLVNRYLLRGADRGHRHPTPASRRRRGASRPTAPPRPALAAQPVAAARPHRGRPGVPVPFYYMVIGALQSEPNSSISGAFPNPANLTLDNLRDIDRAIDLPRPC